MKPTGRILIILLLAKPWISKLSKMNLVKLALILYIANRIVDQHIG